MTVEVNGIAHIQMTVNDIQKSLPFWESLCHFLEMKTLVKNHDFVLHRKPNWDPHKGGS